MLNQIVRTAALALALPLTLAACQRGANVISSPSPGTESGGPVVISTAGPSIPSGTTLQARLNEQLGTANSRVGDNFTATLLTPVLNANREVIIPEGATVNGTVTGLRESQDVATPAVIRVDFQSIAWNGRTAPLQAEVTNTQAETSGPGTTETLQGAGIGAAAGAVLGAVLGKDVRGALTGAAIGAGAGTVISLGTQSQQATLPQGTRMTLRLTQPVPLQ